MNAHLPPAKVLIIVGTWHDHGPYIKHWLNLFIAERERMGVQQEAVPA